MRTIFYDNRRVSSLWEQNVLRPALRKLGYTLITPRYNPEETQRLRNEAEYEFILINQRVGQHELLALMDAWIASHDHEKRVLILCDSIKPTNRLELNQKFWELESHNSRIRFFSHLRQMLYWLESQSKAAEEEVDGRTDP